MVYMLLGVGETILVENQACSVTATNVVVKQAQHSPWTFRFSSPDARTMRASGY